MEAALAFLLHIYLKKKKDCGGAQLVALANAPLYGEPEDKFWLKR